MHLSASTANSAIRQWEVRLSKSKNVPYYFNTATQQSVWDAPAELTADQIQRLPGAKEYLSAGGQSDRPDEVRASHLLVKHRDSRRPSSWKEVSLDRRKSEGVLTPSHPAQHHSLEGRSHADLAQVSGPDQWLAANIRPAGARTL